MEDKFLMIKFTEKENGVTRETQAIGIGPYKLLGFISVAEKELNEMKETIIKKLEDESK